MKKTILIGLDAACWEYLDPLLQSDRLPTIRKLMNSGSWGILGSTMPPWTPTAWSSIVTGKNPGKHGVFDMLRNKPGTYDFGPTDAGARYGTPFWQYLNEAGISVGLVNIPFTHPPSPVNGFMVCGFGTPGTARDLTWPPDVLTSIESRSGPYEPTVPTEMLQSGTPEEILAAEKRHQAYLIDAAIILAEQYQVEVLAINLMLTDHANHKMPRMELVNEAYIQSDADIDRLISSFHPDNVFLISDHGSSRLKGDFLLNVWLREQGYCVYIENTISQKKAALDGILKQWFQDHMGWSGRTEKGIRKLIRTLYPRLPQPVQMRFWDRVEKVIPFAESHMRLSKKPDFRRTTLFPGSLYSGLLYINVSKREPNGIIPADLKKKLVSELKNELSKIKEPDTGERLFTNVYSSDELYSGAAAQYAPDLILDAYRSNWNIRTRQPAPFKGKQHSRYFITFERKGDYGWHSPDGVFIFSGSSIMPGHAAKDAHLMDVPATLLHVYGVPKPDDWDGRVLLELLKTELSQQPVRNQPGDAEQRAIEANDLTAEEAESLTSHLRALGYL